MIRAVLLVIILFTTCQMGHSQSNDNLGSMAVMVTVVSSQSMDAVPVKISISKDQNQSELIVSPSDEKSADLILTDTPYASVNLQIPSEETITNQLGETAQVKDFQLIYGNSQDQAAMDVVSPGSCNELMIPETGRIYIRIGATITSESELKGVYTGSLDFNCSTE